MVAIKILDLETFKNTSIPLIRKEIAVMSMSKHKNIVAEYISFVDYQYLWIVMPLIDAGSVIDVMRQVRPSNCPGVPDEAVIATIMKETLEGLQYLHNNGQMHRDIKAGNILLDTRGNVYLSDYGVSASLKKGQKRGTLVGTPSWMAPEVCSQTGHDEKADIWSIGITLIEMALGQAPYSELQPMKVIVKIMEADALKLEGSMWSDSFKEIIEQILKK